MIITVCFAIHRHEPVMGEHVSPILKPPPYPIPPGCPRGMPCFFECPASCIKFALVIYSAYVTILVSMLFSQIIPPWPSPTESKSLCFTSVSLLLPCI